MMPITKKHVLLLVLLGACKGPQTEPNTVINSPKELFYQPANFPKVAYNFDANPITEAGFKLGKRIFYDGRLSRDGTVSCAECHNQAYAFTHHGHTLSHGIDNQIGKRNAPAIQNMAFMRAFFWDGGVGDLDLLPVVPITNPVEMDEKLANVYKKLQKAPGYPEMFKAAFGSEEITTTRFMQALSQFMNSLISANSRYDQFIRKENGVQLNGVEQAGLAIYRAKCASCHATDLFTDGSFRNNGLEVYSRDPDLGRYLITENDADKHKFKVPSLRNLRYTAPYMHDGRFNTLQEVMRHYASEVINSETLDSELKKENKLGIALSAKEQSDLLAFLETLNDESFINNSRFYPE